ncbi:uncharacterized protein [Amphiura filiformis]|uniref:uncharacterized protein n=1 Tax=Amphiura filiformis TaxID=82378 RepID=UPI003B20E5D5
MTSLEVKCQQCGIALSSTNYPCMACGVQPGMHDQSQQFAGYHKNGHQGSQQLHQPWPETMAPPPPDYMDAQNQQCHQGASSTESKPPSVQASEHGGGQLKQDITKSTPDNQSKGFVSEIDVKKEPPDPHQNVAMETSISSQNPAAKVKADPGTSGQPTLKLLPPPSTNYQPAALVELKIEKNPTGINGNDGGQLEQQKTIAASSTSSRQTSQDSLGIKTSSTDNSMLSTNKDQPSDSDNKDHPSGTDKQVEIMSHSSAAGSGSQPGQDKGSGDEKMDVEGEKGYIIHKPPTEDLEMNEASEDAVSANEDQQSRTSKDNKKGHDALSDSTDGTHKRHTSSDASQISGDSPVTEVDRSNQASSRTHATLADDNPDGTPGDTSSSSSKAKQTLAEQAEMANTGGSGDKAADGGSRNQDTDQEDGRGDGGTEDEENMNKTGNGDPKGGSAEGGGHYYMKSKDNEDEFQPVLSNNQRKKLARQEKNINESRSNNSTLSKEKPIALKASADSGLQVHFHCIIPPDFDYKPNRDKVFVHMGGKDFGDFKYNCAEMTVDKDLTEGYYLLKGCSLMAINSVKKSQVPYKYLVQKNKPDGQITPNMNGYTSMTQLFGIGFSVYQLSSANLEVSGTNMMKPCK